MQLSCVNCGAEFEPDKVSRKLRFASCAYCGTLHNIAEIMAGRSGRVYVPPPVYLPRYVDVAETEAGVTIRFPTRSWELIPLTIIAATLATVAVVAATNVWNDPTITLGQVLWLLGLASLLVTGYFALAAWINRRQVFVGLDHVRLSQHPLPVWPTRGQSLQGAIKVLVRTRGHADGKFEEYVVVVRTDQKRQIDVVTQLTDPDVADVLKHYLLQSLGEEARSEPKAEGRTRMLFSRSSLAPPEKVELSCNCCGSPIPQQCIRTDLYAASCPQCGVVQNVRQFMRHGIPRLPRDPGWRDPWRMKRHRERLIVIRDGDWGAWEPVLFGVVGTYIGLCAVLAFSRAISKEWGFLTLLLPLAAAVASAWKYWKKIQGRQLVATRTGVVVTDTPFGTSRQRSYPAADIAQIAVVEEGWLAHGFGLVLITPDDERVLLLDGLHHLDQAWYLEEHIESLLNIRNARLDKVRRPAG